MNGLPVELRELLVLRYFGELTVAEIAARLDVTHGAVITRLWRARRLLRSQLEDSMDLGPVLKPVAADPGLHAWSLADKPPVYTELNVALHVGGRRYPVDPMSLPAFPDGAGLSLGDIRLAVDRLHAVCLAGETPLTAKLGLWAAPDPFEHAEPAAVWSLVREAEVGQEKFHATNESRLIPTDAARLGTDPDWRHVLRDLHSVGVRHIWFTLLGLEETHDLLVARPGAFAAIVAAMERCAEAGLATGANIVVSTRNVSEIRELAERIRDLGAEAFVPTYVETWSQLRAAYERIRPTPDDLNGLPPAGRDVNWGYDWFWSDPRPFTEAALTRAALDGAPSDALNVEPSGSSQRTLPLFIDGNLDLFVGSLLTPPVQRVGNLQDESPETIYRKLATLRWPPAPQPDPELARRFGDATGAQVHMSRDSLRRKWLAAWRNEERLAWLP